MENRNNVALVDGRWYSVLAHYPRLAHEAKWVEAEQLFTYQGGSEQKYLHRDEVDELLMELDPEVLPEWVTRDLL